MEIQFVTDYPSILRKIDQIDPIRYGRTRNFVDGAVTYLSPYISRGVISTRQVLEIVLAKGYAIEQIEPFVKELCWRDYFQRVAQEKDINQDIKQAQHPVSNQGIPVEVLAAQTGIEGIDNAIRDLYQSGYMHNHCRMYTASLVCNIAQSHWLHPAQWLYYHLLDGDWASNACSWQWVSAANSSKKYYVNQENINKYTHTNQSGTCLDVSYEMLVQMDVPEQLQLTQKLFLETHLPECEALDVDSDVPTFVYNYYNLDPLWHREDEGNRILLLEPDVFTAYPISKKCMEFMLSLAKNIPQLQIYVGSFETLCKQYGLKDIYYKEHPLNKGYKGTEESRDWIADTITGYYPSFFAYWKKVEKQIALI